MVECLSRSPFSCFRWFSVRVSGFLAQAGWKLPALGVVDPGAEALKFQRKWRREFKLLPRCWPADASSQEPKVWSIGEATQVPAPYLLRGGGGFEGTRGESRVNPPVGPAQHRPGGWQLPRHRRPGRPRGDPPGPSGGRGKAGWCPSPAHGLKARPPRRPSDGQRQPRGGAGSSEPGRATRERAQVRGEWQP